MIEEDTRSAHLVSRAHASAEAPTVIAIEPPPNGLDRGLSWKGGAASPAAVEKSKNYDVTSAPDVSLPLDPLLTHGVFENGCQFYVRPCSKPSNSCELRLCVRVGSLCEEEHERGVAHFVEHMGFKGTKSFGHGELISYLSSLGMQYGSCLNAHTNQDETVYKLSVPLPPRVPAATATAIAADEARVLAEEERKGRLSMAINVLNEWATGMRISDEDVQTERRVIQEEWRGKNGASRRILHKYWDAVFAKGGANLIAERFPIGLPEVFMNCDPQVIRDFYRKWYRPELMAVVVVGDIDRLEQEHVLEAIRSTFAVIPGDLTDAGTPSNGIDNGPRPLAPLPTVELPRHPHDLVLVLEDAELTQTSVSLEFFEKLTVANTLTHVRSDVVKRLFTTLVDQRLGAISRRCDGNKAGPFLGAGIACRPVVPDLNCTTLNAICKDDPQSIAHALQALVEECTRAAEHGFTPSELTMAKLKWKSAFSLQLAQEPNSMDVVEDARQHFMRDHATPFAGHTAELGACLELTDDVTLFEVNEYCKRFSVITWGNNGYIDGAEDGPGTDMGACGAAQKKTDTIVTATAAVPDDPHRFRQLTLQHPISEGVGGAIEGSWSEERLRLLLDEALDKVRSSLPTPWADLGIKESLMASPPPPGRVVSVTHLPKLQATEVELSNGIVVAFQRSSRRKEHVAFQGFALGGSSELNELEETAFCMIDEVAGLSGLGELDGDALANLTSTWQTRVNTQRHTYHRGIGGSCPAARLELLLQLLHLRLTPGAQHFKAGSLAKVISLQLEGIKHRDKMPDFHFGEHARISAYGDVPIMRPISPEALEQVSVEDLSRLYTAAFPADATSFTFTFVGELPDDEVLLPLLETYLGSLGATPLPPAAPLAPAGASSLDDAGPESTSAPTHSPPKPFAPRSALSSSATIPFCGVCSIAEVGSCGCCPDPVSSGTNGAADGAVQGARKGGTLLGLSECPDAGASGGASGVHQNFAANTDKPPSPSPWAKTPGRISFVPTPLNAVFSPGKDVVYAGRHTEDAKATCLLAWRVDMPTATDPDADTTLEMRIKAMCVSLETRLLSVLRTENSQVYNVSVGWGRTSLNSFGMINIGYGCDPERTDEVESLLKAELERFKTDGPIVEEVDAVKSILAERHQLALDNNSYWIFYLLDAYKAFCAHEICVVGGGGSGGGSKGPSCGGGGPRADDGGGETTRAGKVELAAAGHSVDRIALHIDPLTPEVIKATAQEVLPIEGSLSLTLLPEPAMTGAKAEVADDQNEVQE